MDKYRIWYDNGSDPSGEPYWEAAELVEAKTPQEAVKIAKRITPCAVCVTLPGKNAWEKRDILASSLRW